MEVLFIIKFHTIEGFVKGGFMREYSYSCATNKLSYFFYISPPLLYLSLCTFSVHWWIIHVCLVQVTIWNIVWCSRRRSCVPWCAHFPADICCLIQEAVKWTEKCAHTEARPRVGSATHCHLDKTNMDKTSMHRVDVLVTPFSTGYTVGN